MQETVRVLGLIPGGEYGSPLQYSYPDNPMDRGAWQATVQRIGHNWSNLAQTQTAHFNKNPSPWSLPSIEILSLFWLISYLFLTLSSSSHAGLLLICFFSVLESLLLLFPGDGTHHSRFAHGVFCSFTSLLKSCCFYCCIINDHKLNILKTTSVSYTMVL